MSHARKRRKMLWDKNKVCFVCQDVIKTFEEASIDHIVPRSLGGSSKLRNLTVSHRKCNQLRGSIICRVVWDLRLKKYYIAKKMQKAWLKKLYERKEGIAS